MKDLRDQAKILDEQLSAQRYRHYCLRNKVKAMLRKFDISLAINLVTTDENRSTLIVLMLLYFCNILTRVATE